MTLINRLLTQPEIREWWEQDSLLTELREWGERASSYHGVDSCRHVENGQFDDLVVLVL
jgi:hypothetical protein